MVRFHDYYFPDGLRWTSLVGLLTISIYLLFGTNSQWFALITLILAVFFFSTKYLIEIDTKDRVIKDLFFVFFIRSGNYINYRTLNSIRIDKVRHTYTANSRARTAVTDYFQYTGTLLYNESSSLELTTKAGYDWFGKEMKRLSKELQIPILKSY